MSKSDIELSIPSELKNITVAQYQKYAKVLKDNKDAEDYEFLDLKSLEIFCGLSLKDSYGLPISLFDEAIKHINKCFSEPTPLITRFSMIGTDGVEVEFGFVPDLDKISYGEFKDAEAYLSDPKDLHKALAVLYRPIIHRNGDLYRIDEYKGSEHLSEIMLQSPVSVALGMQVFFYHLGKRLSDYTMDYTLTQVQDKISEEGESLSEENGELISQYLHLREKMSEESKKLQHFHYTPV